MKRSVIQVIQAPPLVLRREDAAAAMGISVSLFEREVQRGNYPKPRLLANRSTGWLYSELKACADALPVSHLLPVPRDSHKSDERDPDQTAAAQSNDPAKP